MYFSRSLVRGALLPLSFVFVGMGSGDYSALERVIGSGDKPCRSTEAGAACRPNAAFVSFRDLHGIAAAAVEEWEAAAESRAEEGEHGGIADEALPSLASPAEDVRRAIQQRMFGSVPHQFEGKLMRTAMQCTQTASPRDARPTPPPPLRHR